MMMLNQKVSGTGRSSLLLRGIVAFLAVGSVFAGGLPALADERPVNVVLIVTDNQGDWTLGCYGNADIRTPHIDRLAREGRRFTRAFAINPVCSPNRATLLTGLLPSQHGVHSYLGSGAPQTGRNATCVIEEFRTLGEIFRDRGYACAMIGKWHLGRNAQPNEGFADYWITMPTGHTSTFFDAEILEEGRQRTEPEHLTRFWTKHALRFLERSQMRPFFLYLAFNGPYGLGAGQLRDCERAPHWLDYAQGELPSFPRTIAHPWLRKNREFVNHPTCIRRYAAEVSAIDDAVGVLRARLRELRLEENTLIVMTGDNGWAGGQQGLWGMGDHTRPKSAFDPTMRVPLIWWQPRRIVPGVGDQMVSHLDFFPTLLKHLGFAEKLPDRQLLAGRDYSPAFRGRAAQPWQNVIYYEFEELRAVRTDRAKLILRHAAAPQELYDLEHDPQELRNLYDDPSSAALRLTLRTELTDFFQRHAEPSYDLWSQGKSKAPLLGVN